MDAAFGFGVAVVGVVVVVVVSGACCKGCPFGEGWLFKVGGFVELRLGIGRLIERGGGL